MIYNFPEALSRIFDGVRMWPTFMPRNVFIELQKPDAGSMNTEPYLKMVVVEVVPVGEVSKEGFSKAEYKITSCEPWEPGRRSLFSKDWAISDLEGVDLKNQIIIDSDKSVMASV